MLLFSRVIYWKVRLLSRIKVEGVKGMDNGSTVILARYKFHFIIEHDNLV